MTHEVDSNVVSHFFHYISFHCLLKLAIDQRIALNKSAYIHCYYIKLPCQKCYRQTLREEEIKGDCRKDEKKERETQTDRGKEKEEKERGRQRGERSLVLTYTRAVML